jgi:signal transduction histidine kinase
MVDLSQVAAISPLKLNRARIIFESGACADSNRDDKRIILCVRNGEGRIKTSVIDPGVGIPAENVTRIFNHGFTVKKDGPGFGPYSRALSTKEMGGSRTVFSEGRGCRAGSTVNLPAQNSKTNA